MPGFADHPWALVDEFAGLGIERVDLNLGLTRVPHVFKQRDFWDDNTDERNREGRSINKRLPLVNPENRSKNFQAQLRFLGICRSPYVLFF